MIGRLIIIDLPGEAENVLEEMQVQEITPTLFVLDLDLDCLP